MIDKEYKLCVCVICDYFIVIIANNNVLGKFCNSTLITGGGRRLSGAGTVRTISKQNRNNKTNIS